MLKPIFVTMMLLSVGLAAMPTAAANCADTSLGQCVRDLRDFLLFNKQCFYGPVSEPFEEVDNFCWAP